MRMRRGLVAELNAPTGRPPSAAVRVRQLPSDNAATFRFAVDHAESDISGAHLLVEITPPTPRLTRKPRETELRCIRVAPEPSFVPLKSSGAEYEISGARFAVAAGERYGMRVRIVSAECLVSTGSMLEFVREWGSQSQAAVAATQTTNTNSAPTRIALTASRVAGPASGSEHDDAAARREHDLKIRNLTRNPELVLFPP